MRENLDAPVIRYLTVANTEVLVCNSLNCHKEVLQTKCYSFRKPDRWLRMFESMVGKGVLSMEGAEHRAARKMLAGPFSLSNIRKLEPVFLSKAKDVNSLFDYAIAANPGGEWGVIDCTDTFSKATLDIIGATTLGIDLANITSTNFGSHAPAAKKDNAYRKDHENYSFHQAYTVTFSQDATGRRFYMLTASFPHAGFPLKQTECFSSPPTGWPVH